MAGTIYGLPSDGSYPDLIRPRGSRVIVLGDSIDAAVSGWFPYLAALAGMNVIRNAGIGGDRTDAMLGRLQADVLDYAPDVVITGGATNDHSQGIPEATTRDNIEQMVQAIREAGATPVLRTSPPNNVAASSPPWNSLEARREQILRHNAWVKEYGAREGIEVLDIHAPLVDAATGGFKSGFNSDSTHPNEEGSRAAADHLIAAGLPDFLRGSFDFTTSAVDATNVVKNGTFALDGNSDGLADDWTQNIAGAHVTRTLTPASAPAAGNWQRFATDGTNAAVMTQDVFPGSRFAEGDVMEVCGRISTSGGGCPALVRVSLYDATPNGTITPIYNTTTAIDDGVFSGRVAIGAGTTRVRIQIQAGTIGATSPAGWIEVAQVTLRNVTKLGMD